MPDPIPTEEPTCLRHLRHCHQQSQDHDRFHLRGPFGALGCWSNSKRSGNAKRRKGGPHPTGRAAFRLCTACKPSLPGTTLLPHPTGRGWWRPEEAFRTASRPRRSSGGLAGSYRHRANCSARSIAGTRSWYRWATRPSSCSTRSARTAAVTQSSSEHSASM